MDDKLIQSCMLKGIQKFSNHEERYYENEYNNEVSTCKNKAINMNFEFAISENEISKVIDELVHGQLQLKLKKPKQLKEKVDLLKLLYDFV